MVQINKSGLNLSGHQEHLLLSGVPWRAKSQAARDGQSLNLNKNWIPRP